MDVLNDSPTRRPPSKVQVLEGRITEVGEDFLTLGRGTSRVLLVEGLACGFQVGQQVTITAVAAPDGTLNAFKIVLAPREKLFDRNGKYPPQARRWRSPTGEHPALLGGPPDGEERGH
jgi:hypothetical protein